jgi:hypothetical protein
MEDRFPEWSVPRCYDQDNVTVSVPGGYKYGNLTLQVGGVSDETLKLVTGPARLGPLNDYTANCRPVLSSERAPHSNKTANFKQQHSDRK